eukprot:4769766-Pleurochrysis_carterae.AAC.1
MALRSTGRMCFPCARKIVEGSRRMLHNRNSQSALSLRIAQQDNTLAARRRVGQDRNFLGKLRTEERRVGRAERLHEAMMQD